MEQDNVRLAHIAESITAIEQFIHNKTIEDFQRDRMLRSALVHECEIIGEAIKNISSDFRNLHPEIPWRKIAGMRDVLAHEYFQFDSELVWESVIDDIPRLKHFLEGLEK